MILASLLFIMLAVNSSQVESIMTNAVIITTGIAGLLAGIQAARKPKRKSTVKKASKDVSRGRSVHTDVID